jgi:hypothetical protein
MKGNRESDYLKCGIFNKRENLFNRQGKKKLLRQNGSGWAQEVRETFVKVVMDLVS